MSGVAPDELLLEAQKALHIRSVYLRSSSFELKEDFFPDAERLEREIRVASVAPRTLLHYSLTSEEDGKSAVEYRVLFGANLFPVSVSDDEAADPANATKRLASIVATFAAFYDVKSPITDDHIKAFGIKNAPFHIWPYWREFVHSTFGRMALAGIVLPMMHRLKAASKPQELAKDTE